MPAPAVFRHLDQENKENNRVRMLPGKQIKMAGLQFVDFALIPGALTAFPK